MDILQHWKELVGSAVFIGTAVGTFILGRNSQKIKDKKEVAIARQEEVKILKEEAQLTTLIKDLYTNSAQDFVNRIERLEDARIDLEKKYGEILLRNALLEERAQTYEEKYNKLEKEHNKLKSDYEKIHQENKGMRKEIDELKNTV